MGLDMFLTKHVFVGANYEHRNVTGKVDIKVGDELLDIPFKKISKIVLEACYWRKANAIHKWFVDNCQDGIDECQVTYVSKEQLTELLDLCKQVKKNHNLAHSLLPSESGFFFGGTEYDEWYFDSINYTIRELTKLLDHKDVDCGEFYYQSSW
jgi:hypothetical protein